MNNFPLAAGDPVGDSLLTCGMLTNHAQLAIYGTEAFDSLDIIAQPDLDQIDNMTFALARRIQVQGGYRSTAFQTMNLKAPIW